MNSVWDIINYYRSLILSDPETFSLHAPVIQARALENVLLNIPIRVNPQETIAGDFGWKCLDRIQAEKLLRKIQTSIPAPAESASPQKSLNSIMKENFCCYGDYCLSHTCADYEKIVTLGVSGILDKINLAAQNADEEKRLYLHAMEITLKALCAWAQRYSQQAMQMADECREISKKQHLLHIAANCSRVPMQPAENFQQAIQAIWLTHAVIGFSELSDASISLGRLDQYLYPIYCRTLDQGTGHEQLARNLEDLFRKLNRYGDASSTVNLGGLDSDGMDLTNPLSWLILNIAKKLRMPAPILAARIHKDIPIDFFDSLMDAKLAATGQLTLYGEIPCTEAILESDVSPSVVHNWSANSSMGLIMPGQEVSDMWAGIVNCLLPLELTLNNGASWSNELPFNCKTPPKEFYKSFEEVIEQYFRYLDEIIFFCVTENRHATKLAAAAAPNPYLSSLLDDCIERGLDRAAGGGRYHVATIEGFGLINASDSLMAIKKLVFDNHNFPLRRLVQAVMENYENAPGIQQALESAPKYGNSEKTADEMARLVTDNFAQLVRKYSDDKICYAPSMQTLDLNVAAGKLIGASTDGRETGDPLAKNIGISPQRQGKGKTALVLSAAYIDQKKFFGGQSLDLTIEEDSLDSLEFKNKLQSLIQTYFKMGGLQIQIHAPEMNSIRKAVEFPRLFEERFAQITGYSAQFAGLNLNNSPIARQSKTNHK